MQFELSVYSPSRKKLCILYNSSVQISGQAQDVVLKKNDGEISSLTFVVPAMMTDVSGSIIENYRCDHLKNENLVYYTKNGNTDVYRIKSCDESVSGKKQEFNVSCLHVSETLKTRNITQEYDLITLNAEEHLQKALQGTGWSVGTVDDFYEDNIYEKEFVVSGQYMSPPSDMAFGAYAEFEIPNGTTQWDSSIGWVNSTIHITSLGKNMFDGLYEMGHLSATTGLPIYVGNALRYRSINYIYVKPFFGQSIHLSGNGFASAEFFWYTEGFAFISSTSAVTSVTVPVGAAYVKFCLYYNANGTIEFPAAPTSIQLELSGVTSYEKYKSPYTVTFDDLGQYDSVNRFQIIRATGYNNTTHTTYQKTNPTLEPLSLFAVKMYDDGIIYYEHIDGSGSITVTAIYSVESETDASPKVKKRSIEKESGVNALDHVKTIAELFDGKLSFDGYNKEVNLTHCIGVDRHLSYKIGKNAKAISKNRASTDLITRLHVTGQTSESGYIGIEEVNPLGTSFILDFSHFIDAGMLSQEQIDAISTYKTSIIDISGRYSVEVDELMRKQNSVNSMIGQTQFAFAHVASMMTTKVSIEEESYVNGCGNPEVDDIVFVKNTFNTWQLFTVMSFNASTREIELSGEPLSAVDLVWIHGSPAGTIGAKIYEINALLGILDSLQTQYDESEDDEEKESILVQIEDMEQTIDYAYFGDLTSVGLYSLLAALHLESVALIQTSDTVQSISEEYALATEVFENTLGDAVKDGIFPQGEYASGQELNLYIDAVKFLYEASHPKLEYTVDPVELSKVPGYEIEEIDYGDIVYITEPKIGVVNLEATVTSYTEMPISKKLNSFNIGNYKTSVKWMEDINNSMKKLKANSKIYDRANSISPNGLIDSEVLIHSINNGGVGAFIDIVGNNAMSEFITKSDAKDLVGYNVIIYSTRGTIFTKDITSTTLRARVYNGGTSVTHLIPAANFTWTRTSDDVAGDAVWNADPAHKGVKSIDLTTDDIQNQGNISCIVIVPE